jgi:hypothetical protein
MVEGKRRESIMTVEIRPYQDALDESFANSGLDEDAFEDYAEGWNEQQDTESLQEMTQEDYDARLDNGITTEIINFNGLMLLYEDKNFNGEMIKYVAEQIMTGYATDKIGIGYEVIIIDENPSGHLAMGDYVIVSSKDLVDMRVAAPLVYAAGGHWCMYLRRENLKHYLTPAIIMEQTDFIIDNNLEGTIAEVEYDGYEKTEWIEGAVLNPRDSISNRGKLCVNFGTGATEYMETPTKGWAIVKNKTLMGTSCQTTIPSLEKVLSKLGLSGDADDTSLMINCKSLIQAKEITATITSWDFFYVEQDDKVVGVYY